MRFVAERWSAALLSLALMLIVSRGAAPAQDTSSIASDYVRTDFTLESGLPDNTVNAIVQTGNGLLWVGTQSGLASFDGRIFTPVRLRIPGAAPPGAVNALVEGADGDLWVGSDAGIVRIPKTELNDPSQTDSTSYRVGKEQSDEVQTLFTAKNGVLWAGTNHGLYRFDGHGFVSIAPSLYVSRIKEAADGNLLLITGAGFFEYDGHRLFAHTGLGARFGVDDGQIFDVLQDVHGTDWFATLKGIRTIGDHAVAPISPRQPATTSTAKLYVDRKNTVWASTGIGVYRITGDRMETPAPQTEARAVFLGKDGDLWLGRNGNGLVHLQHRLVRNYTMADGLQNDLTMAVLPARDGRLWIGNNCGLAVLDGSHTRTFKEKDGIANSCVWALAQDHQDNIWIGSYGGGLFRYREGKFTQFNMEQGLPSRIIFQITVVRDGSLWIATPDGLSHMESGRFHNYTIADGLSSSRILDVHQDRAGTIWVATQGGIDRFENGRFVALPRSPQADDLLPSRFAEDSAGHLYIADLPRGLSLLENNHLVPIDDDLNVVNMVEAPNHDLWFSSHAGIIRVTAAELARFRRDHTTPLNYEQIDRADGMLSTQASIGSPNIGLTPDGKLWVATVRGLAMLDTRQLQFESHRPKLFVSAVVADGMNKRAGSELVLPQGPHHVELHVAAVDLATPQKIRLQYRMENVDAGWLDADSTRTATYTNLPVGAHNFFVRATDSRGNWDAGRVVYRVVQQPYFYQSRVFQVSVLVAALLMLAVAYLLRVRHLIAQTRTILEERQMEREGIARDLHDTFLQGVQGLILRFHTGTQQLDAGQPAKALFEEALQQSDRVMLEGRSVLSRLRTTASSGTTLQDAYATIGLELRSLSEASFEVIVNGRSRGLHTVVQEELYRVGREALFNAFRHANASRIEVELQFGVLDLRLCFRDDGVGIDPSVLRDGSAPGHYGLPGMRERVTRIGGHLDLWSRAGAGTEVEVKIPGAIAYRNLAMERGGTWVARILRGRAI